MQTVTIPTTALNSPLRGHGRGHPRRGFPPSLSSTRPSHLATTRSRWPPSGRISCDAAVTTADASPSFRSDATLASSSGLDPESEAAAARVGARVRVKAPVKVYHVQKVPELILKGMEGEIKQYVGMWKGKRISANLPFRVEFVLPDGVEGRPGPLKLVAHLKEDEFEYLRQD